MISVSVALSPLTAGAQQTAGEQKRVLLLTKSSGFQHSSITRDGDEPSHVERVFSEIARDNGIELVATKDAGRINGDELDRFDAVVFYTTGDLTQSGGQEPGIFAGDGHPAMPEDGLEALLTWIREGGGFLGYHCASDTFHSPEEGVSDYIAMVGGEFRVHGAQFEGTLRVVDPTHPITGDAPAELRRLDEWYLFKNLDTERMHVLAVLDPGAERERQALYDLDPYPIVWTKAYGQGRVYYDAMGHREDVWDDPTFRSSVLAALRWALGEGPVASEPNYRSLFGADTVD